MSFSNKGHRVTRITRSKGDVEEMRMEAESHPSDPSGHPWKGNQEGRKPVEEGPRDRVDRGEQKGQRAKKKSR